MTSTTRQNRWSPPGIRVHWLPLVVLAGISLWLGCSGSDVPWSGAREVLPIGTPVPPLTAGEWVNPRPPEDLKGQVVLVDVFATWCGPCRSATPGLVHLYEKLKADHPDLIFLSLTAEGSDDREAIHDFVDEYGIPWGVGFNARETILELGVQGYPTLLVVDRQGRVAYVEEGYSGSHRELEQALEAALQNGGERA